MKYSIPSKTLITVTMKNLLVIAFTMFIVACGEKDSNGVYLDELVDREGVIYLNGSNTPYTGKGFKLHEIGQKAYEVSFKDGKEQGVITTWYANGLKKAESNWENGKKEGLFTEWYENGQKQLEGRFKNGQQEGLLTAWHEDGLKQMEGMFKEGEPISSKYWNSKGEEVDPLAEAKQETDQIFT